MIEVAVVVEIEGVEEAEEEAEEVAEAAVLQKQKQLLNPIDLKVIFFSKKTQEFSWPEEKKIY